MNESCSDLMNNLAVGVVVTKKLDEEEKLIYINDTASEITGYTLEDIPNLEAWYRKAYAGIEDYKTARLKCKNDLMNKNIKARKIKTKSGDYRYIEFRVSRLDDNRKIWNLIDVTERIRQQKKAEKYQHLLEKLFMNPILGIIVLDDEYNLIRSNQQFRKIFGYNKHDIKNTNMKNLIVPFKSEKEFREDVKFMEKNDYIKKEIEALNKENVLKDYILYAFKAELADGSDGYHAFFLDITERKKQERELKEIKDRLEMAVEGANLGIWDWNIETGDIYYNNNWAEMLGYEAGELEYKVSSWENLIHEKDKNLTNKKIMEHLKGKNRLYKTEHRLRTKDGNYKWIKDLGKVSERNDEGEPVRAVGIHIDIDEEKRAKEEIEYLSYHDELTGLYNRRYFESHVKRFENSRLYPLSIIVGDLDNLKDINDELGHQMGDYYIKRASDILNNIFRKEDVLARMGGDEFAVLLPETNIKTAEKICRRVGEEFKKVNQVENLSKSLSISLGYAELNNVSDEFEKYYKKADQRMYENKNYSFK